MSEEYNPLRARIVAALRRAWNPQEDQDYDVPFTAFTWEHWQAMQIHMILNFARFQRAISNRELRQAVMIVWEMLDIIQELQMEACAWINEGKEPGEHESADHGH
ncbi:hypothetical protein EPA93_26980 [Ktedonosporobacter rubrisoli]|uniref:Uncharacterized protein n=1 Tax=Ktedonosporobacter rubrisoli TaxID=2509675 RepID=A0A4P6JVP8_KTERU|nr:hypothetical protein [Ktedonosporobacter rubrisoli]QBD79261.1 hypothetical protein EPA93_26060 [Ktedonosporobacter rubrisoli]QBD79432.1 hypothetical protein EPA93_26980 [Ktedonosporobacter rubrisoli]